MNQSSLLSELACPASKRGWNVEARVRTIAGGIVLASLLLSLIDRRWLWITAFVGVNLLQSGLTGWCMMSNLLGMLSKPHPPMENNR